MSNRTLTSLFTPQASFVQAEPASAQDPVHACAAVALKIFQCDFHFYACGMKRNFDKFKGFECLKYIGGTFVGSSMRQAQSHTSLYAASPQLLASCLSVRTELRCGNHEMALGLNHVHSTALTVVQRPLVLSCFRRGSTGHWFKCVMRPECLFMFVLSCCKCELGAKPAALHAARLSASGRSEIFRFGTSAS